MYDMRAHGIVLGGLYDLHCGLRLSVQQEVNEAFQDVEYPYGDLQ